MIMLLDDKIKLLRKSSKGNYHIGKNIFGNKPEHATDLVELEIELF